MMFLCTYVFTSNIQQIQTDFLEAGSMQYEIKVFNHYIAKIRLHCNRHILENNQGFVLGSNCYVLQQYEVMWVMLCIWIASAFSPEIIQIVSPFQPARSNNSRIIIKKTLVTSLIFTSKNCFFVRFFLIIKHLFLRIHSCLKNKEKAIQLTVLISSMTYAQKTSQKMMSFSSQKNVCRCIF